MFKIIILTMRKRNELQWIGERGLEEYIMNDRVLALRMQNETYISIRVVVGMFFVVKLTRFHRDLESTTLGLQRGSQTLGCDWHFARLRAWNVNYCRRILLLPYLSIRLYTISDSISYLLIRRGLGIIYMRAFLSSVLAYKFFLS